MGERNGVAGESRDAAERTAIAVLSYLASEPEELARFLALTGLTPRTLRAATAEPTFAASIFDYLLGNEPLLLAFAERHGIPPAEMAALRRSLYDGPEPG